MKIVDIERQLVELYKKNTNILVLTDIDEISNLMYVVKYCNSFMRKPKLIITKEEKSFKSSILRTLKEYKGKIEFKI